MINIIETAYPKIRSYITKDELYRIYTPSDEELILAQENTKGDLSIICFLVTLKCFQRLGYFINITDVPKSIIEHITNHCNSIFNNSILKNYDKSSSKKRHLIIIRDYLKITAYGEETRKIVTNVATEAAKAKDNDADIINIVIEELIRQRYELPAFSTLERIAKSTRHSVYNSYYKYIYENLPIETIESINNLFNIESNNTYSPWSLLKEEPGKPSHKNLKEINLHYQRLKAFKINETILSDIPNIKVKHFSEEAKTLNSAQMKKLESYKRYTLAVCFINQTISSMLDDLGEMFIKIVKSSQNKAKEKLNEYKLANSKVADDLILTLRNFLTAYSNPGTSEERLGAIENILESNNVGEIIEKCDNHNAYSGNNYYHFSWQCLKGNRSALFKLIDSLELYATTQNKSIEVAIDTIKKYRYSNKLEYIDLNDECLDLSWVNDQWWKLLTG